MFRIKRVSGYLLAAALITGSCLADDAAPLKFYKLEFVVKEVEGSKVLNARSYWAVIGAEQGPQTVCSIRTGSKVPTPTTLTAPAQYTYLDLGVSIDCRSVKEVGGELTLSVHADISSTLQESSTASALPPVVRENKWGSMVIVPLRKPTVIFSSDDVTGKHQMQLELTATPIT